jgi:predicted ferric reductase
MFRSNEKLKFRILYALMALSTLPYFLLVKLPDIDNLGAISVYKYISSVTGYIGIALLLWMYILGTRSVVGLYFNDMSHILSLHKFFGKYGMILLVLHPIFATLYYGQKVYLYPILFKISTPLEKSITYGRIAFVTLFVVWLTSAIIRSKIKYRPWRYIHLTSYVILPLSLLHVPDIGSSYQILSIRTLWYITVAVFVIFSILRLRFLVGLGKWKYTITHNMKVSEGVYTLRMKGVKKLAIYPGQYVYLQKKLWAEEHPFSVMDYLGRTNSVTLGYKVFGKFSASMSQLKAGDQVYLDGPYGVFTHQIDPTILGGLDADAIFIAGGIGITPFIKHIMNRPVEHTWLFYANQGFDLAAYSPDLKSRLGDRQIDVFNHSDANVKNIEHGYITSEIIQKYITLPHLKQYYICGPSPMMAAAKKILLQIGVPKSQIHLEEFGY